jgi:hypothetical protein
MSFATLLAEDRRLVILRCLAEMPGWEANEGVLRTGLAHFGHRVGMDIVRAELQFLADHELVRIEKLHSAGGELWLATLTGAGRDVAEGDRVHPGVKRRGPE